MDKFWLFGPGLQNSNKWVV